MITRKQYMNKEFTFREYYGQFSSEHVVTAVANYIGADLLMRSEDKHLNDIPLSIWDNAPWFGMSQMVAKANWSGGVSLSDKVCAVKVAAHKYIEEQGK